MPNITPRPLVGLNAVQADLDMSAGQIGALLDEGKLVAFNIGARENGKVELRILKRSVAHFVATGKRLPGRWSEIFKLVIPHEKPFLRGTEISRALNCDRGHTENLILSGLLVCVKMAKPGPGGSPIVPRHSFEAFLKGRML